MGKPVRTIHKHRLRCPTSKSTRAAENHADPFGSVTLQQRQDVVGYCLQHPSSARGKSTAPLPPFSYIGDEKISPQYNPKISLPGKRGN